MIVGTWKEKVAPLPGTPVWLEVATPGISNSDVQLMKVRSRMVVARGWGKLFSQAREVMRC